MQAIDRFSAKIDDFFLDFTADKRLVFFILTLLIALVSRAPFLLLGKEIGGISSDVDAPSYVRTALILHHEGNYEPTRYPGYLIMEITNFLLLSASNMNTLSVSIFNVFMFAIASTIFAQIVKLYSTGYYFLTWLTFLLLPLWIVENCSTTEYTLSVTFLMAGWYLLVKNRATLGGMLIGLAIATRPSQTPILFPLFLLMFWQQTRSIKAIISFCISCISITIIGWFLPMLLLTGDISFLQVAPWHGTLKERILGAGYDLQRAFGMQALIAIVLGIVLNADKIKSRALRGGVDVCLYGTLLNLAIIIYAPHKVAYSLLLTPFLLPLLSDFRRYISFPVISLALLSFALISLPSVDIYDGRPRFFLASSGKIATEREYRRTELLIAKRVVENAPKGSVVLTGYLHLLGLILYKGSVENEFSYMSRYGAVYINGHDVWLIGRPVEAWVGMAEDISDKRLTGISFVEGLIKEAKKVYYIPQTRHLYQRSGVAHWTEKAIPWNPAVQEFPPTANQE